MLLRWRFFVFVPLISESLCRPPSCRSPNKISLKAAKFQKIHQLQKQKLDVFLTPLICSLFFPPSDIMISFLPFYLLFLFFYHPLSLFPSSSFFLFCLLQNFLNSSLCFPFSIPFISPVFLPPSILSASLFSLPIPCLYPYLSLSSTLPLHILPSLHIFPSLPPPAPYLW